jgi:hypothetical protein
MSELEDTMLNMPHKGLSMNNADLIQIAEKVSVILQLDRARHTVPTQVDMQALTNIPSYISSVFETAHELDTELTPVELYKLINRRISDLQTQIYLLRLEMDNRSERDPAKLYEDPLVISAYGERLTASTNEPRAFMFEPSLIAYGWHKVEHSGASCWRWMRPGQKSVVCLPHLGKIDQLIEIWGHTLDPAQLDDFTMHHGEIEGEIERDPSKPNDFVARLMLPTAQLASANLVPVEFGMTDFRQPNPTDTRLLGACITRFNVSPLKEALGEDIS